MKTISLVRYDTGCSRFFNTDYEKDFKSTSGAEHLIHVFHTLMNDYCTVVMTFSLIIDFNIKIITTRVKDGKSSETLAGVSLESFSGETDFEIN